MAIAYRKRKNMDEAVACMKRAAMIAPDYDPIAGSLGGFLLEAKRYDEADKYFRARVKSHPNDLSGYLGLGYIAQQANRLDEALDWYLKALQIEPTSQDVLASLFQTYYEMGRLDQAENVLRKWIEENPTDKSARDRLAELERERAAAESTQARPKG
jgi:protein O-GlcNAc transferase